MAILESHRDSPCMWLALILKSTYDFLITFDNSSETDNHSVFHGKAFMSEDRKKYIENSNIFFWCTNFRNKYHPLPPIPFLLGDFSFYIIIISCGVGDRSQGLIHAGQVLCCWVAFQF